MFLEVKDNSIAIKLYYLEAFSFYDLTDFVERYYLYFVLVLISIQFSSET
jgi:hypothetical protein